MGQKMKGAVVVVALLYGASQASAQTAADDGSKQVRKENPTAVEPKVRYKKNKQVDFSNQNIEGNVGRPDAALITAGDGSTDNGILRLREDFVDKFTAYCGEEIK